MFFYFGFFMWREKNYLYFLDEDEVLWGFNCIQENFCLIEE